MKKEYIVFIDSGVGGLSTLAKSMLFTRANYIYFADNLHSPYGSHTDGEIFEFLREIIEDLRKKFRIKLVVLACNTATTSSIKNLRNFFKDLSFVGTEPAVKLASDGGAKNVLCLTTPTTAKQVRFRALQDMLAVPVSTLPIDSLAMDIEQFLTRNQVCDRLGLLRDLCVIKSTAQNFDAVVLGCTHYVLIRDVLERLLSLPIFDGNFGVAKQICKLYHSSQSGKSTVKFMFSDSSEALAQKYRKIFKQILANQKNVC